MRRALLAKFLLWTGFVASYAVETGESMDRRAVQDVHQKASIPSRDGLRFVIDGQAEYFAGSNSYWIPFLKSNSDVDLVMSHLKQSGLKVLRVWGFNDVNEVPTDGRVWFHHISNGKSTINVGADGLQRLDYVVKSAEAHDVKLIVNFVNNWDDYGGIAAYNAAFGGNSTSWYTDGASQKSYREYIKAVISRYKGSSAIFAWELANEPRCRGCDTSVIYNWVKSTSAFIKSLEPARMVCIGDEGMGLTTQSDNTYPFTYYEGIDFEKNLNIPTIDFGTLHLYPGSWNEQDPWGNLWIEAHGAACVKAGKPCLLEEYGSLAHASSEVPWQQTALKTNGIAGDTFWQYGDNLSSGPSPDDGYTIYRGTANYTILVTDHVKNIKKANRH
ncbi:putative mannan endo-1,4-beta-mannosidase A [Penicillium brasilianum]|uniref:mannan endo-1,4-beta-mannosidase n=1 Tax=Penicillium brasilianum TaxID=104259 RepID=A0A1S9RRD6_PENBI|nr:putative mannan endo-1,4-beta-mannosidase A [Penicillium brasilianum]